MDPDFYSYPFRQAVGGFFLAPTGALRPLLLPGLSPLEARPGHGIVAITSFDFTDSAVGAYGELVLSVLVPPWASRDQALPVAAIRPFLLATTTPRSLAHAAERYFLPELDHCLDMRFEGDAESRRVSVRDGGRPVLDLTVARTRPEPGTREYQVFSRPTTPAGPGPIHRARLLFLGPLEQHEQELGRIALHDHPIAAQLAGLIVDEIPFVEQSMGDGEERYGTPVRHGSEGSAR